MIGAAFGHRKKTNPNPNTVTGTKHTQIRRRQNGAGWELVGPVMPKGVKLPTDTASCSECKDVAPAVDHKCGFNICDPTRRALLPQPADRRTLGVATVEGFGIVIVHEDGWRTQHQTVLDINLPGFCMACTAPVTDFAIRLDLVTSLCRTCSPGLDRISRADLASATGVDIKIDSSPRCRKVNARYARTFGPAPLQGRAGKWLPAGGLVVTLVLFAVGVLAGTPSPTPPDPIEQVASDLIESGAEPAAATADLTAALTKMSVQWIAAIEETDGRVTAIAVDYESDGKFDCTIVGFRLTRRIGCAVALMGTGDEDSLVHLIASSAPNLPSKAT